MAPSCGRNCTAAKKRTLRRLRHRWALVASSFLVAAIGRMSTAFNLHAVASQRPARGHGNSDVLGGPRRRAGKSSPYLSSWPTTSHMAAAAAEAPASDVEAEGASLAPRPEFVAKVSALAFGPYALRCIVDALRGTGISLPAPWQAAFACMWMVGTIANAVPGRFDGGTKIMSEDGRPVVRFFTPAGWAFAIWGPIFLGEFLAMVYLTALAEPCASVSTGMHSVLATTQLGSLVAPGWCAAIAAQVGWCATFRPGIGVSNLWISTACLGMTAALLGAVHRGLCRLAASGGLGLVSNCLVRVPITLHFGWITCATLVNMNKWLSLNGSSRGLKVAAAYLSVALAVGLAAYVSSTTRDPIFAFVVFWSLSAVSVEGGRDGTPGHLRSATGIGAGASCLMMLACVAARCLLV